MMTFFEIKGMIFWVLQDRCTPKFFRV